MKSMNFYVLVMIICCLMNLGANAQNICGRWYSSDSTRIYYVYKKGQYIEAVLESSTRKNDKPGTIVLTGVEEKRTGFYEGIIHAVSDDAMTEARLTSNGSQQLNLRLRRF